MSGLFDSRRFWLALFDVVLSSALYFGGKYLGATAFEDVKFIIAAIQPVILLVIGAYTVDKFSDKSTALTAIGVSGEVLKSE